MGGEYFITIFENDTNNGATMRDCYVCIVIQMTLDWQTDGQTTHVVVVIVVVVDIGTLRAGSS